MFLQTLTNACSVLCCPARLSPTNACSRRSHAHGARSVGQTGHDSVEVSSKPSDMTRTEWLFHGIQAFYSTSSHERDMKASVCRSRTPFVFLDRSSEIAMVLLRHLCGVKKSTIAAEPRSRYEGVRLQIVYKHRSKSWRHQHLLGHRCSASSGVPGSTQHLVERTGRTHLAATVVRPSPSPL
ncbi:hypothetical protein GY45DRAFT_279722 [Cubamyces sp. BRFM 1775]|nr:hypothetical protein GY45DRAFT_279722 [Cubamyces sp. BRFM 1775]